jgi:hypothetical protein
MIERRRQTDGLLGARFSACFDVCWSVGVVREAFCAFMLKMGIVQAMLWSLSTAGMSGKGDQTLMGYVIIVGLPLLSRRRAHPAGLFNRQRRIIGR